MAATAVLRRETGRRLRRASSQPISRAIWLGVLIGLVSGFGAILFSEAIIFATEHLLGAAAGFHPPEPLGEGGPGSDAFDAPDRLWVLPLILGFGGLMSGILVYYLAPEAEGHGTDAAIEAFHLKGGRTRLRVIPVKLLASAFTIGSGGAAGREGPTAQIGGGFGSFIADRLNLGAIERRKALAAGMGAGIGAIFRAPLGGAMMAAEVMYTHDFEADVILLGLISSIVAYAVFGSYYDYSPMFGNTADFEFKHAYELLYYAGLGAVCGLMGILYVRGFYGTHALFKRLNVPWIAKPVIGGVLAGCIGMVIPESIHVGYGWVQRSLTVEQLADFSPWLLLALPFARIATTSLTVGSGGSGGIFGPGMVIGGVTGALAFRIFHDVPGFPQEPGPVVIIGMIAMFGSVSHAPLAMLLMVGEMTGNLSLLAPAMVAVAVATLLVGDITIYKSQVPTRADSNAHRHRFAFPLLSALPAQRAVSPLPQIPDDYSLLQAISVVESSGSTQAVVVAANGTLVGDVSLESLRAGAAENANQPVTAIAGRIPSTIPADMPLDEALDRLTAQERRWLPVVDQHDRGRILGAFDAAALIRSYRRAVSSQVRPLTPVDEDVSTLELTLPEASPVAGLRLSEANLPPGVRILTVERDGHVTPPDGSTLLEVGDRLTIALPATTSARVLTRFLGD
ncbi:MAG: chloride channel protein [Dehalococcoidia bacterium]|nr:chloride channel protein [Thermoflexaceae bacterium]